jgi:putative flippase GtrA
MDGIFCCNSFCIRYRNGYFLFRIFVFKVQRQYTFRSGAYFILVNLVGILQAWMISVGLVNYLFPILEFDFYNLEIAHSIGILVPAFTSYFGHKWLSFS